MLQKYSSADKLTAAVTSVLAGPAFVFMVVYLCRMVSYRKGGVSMKRVKAACLFQTLVFSQKPELELSKEAALRTNRDEIEHYKTNLKRAGTNYQITRTDEQEDGSIIVHVRKQNSNADASEYFM